MIFVVLAIGFFCLVVLTAFMFGGAAIPLVIALVGIVVVGGAFLVRGGGGGGGLRRTLDRAERRSPGHLGPGGPDDPDA